MHAPSMDDRMTFHLNLNIRMLYDATLLPKNFLAAFPRPLKKKVYCILKLSSYNHNLAPLINNFSLIMLSSLMEHVELQFFKL